MFDAAVNLSCLLAGFIIGMWGYAQAENRAFRRLLNAQGRSYAVLPEDAQ